MMQEEEAGGQLLVYRSSAGSGKTSTLVSTFLELALSDADPSRYGRILAITFTNKAAKEMRERVLDELSSLADGSPLSPPTAKLLEKKDLDERTARDRASRTLTHLLHHYSRLSISTIDRFVHRIVQQFARELGIPTDFELIMEEDEMLQQAVDVLISKAGGEHKALTQALTGFATAKAADDKSWHIEKDLLDASKILLQEEGRSAWSALKGVGPEKIMEVRRDLDKKQRSYEEKLKGVAEKGFQLIEREGIHPKSFYKGEQGGVPSYLRKLRKADPSMLEPTSTLLKTLEEDRWTSGKCPADEADRIHGIAEELRALIRDAIEMVEKEGPEHMFRTLAHQELYRLSLLSGVEEALEGIKEEEGSLLISDLDRIIADVVLQEPAPFIYERIGDRYDHLLFDEFQDTSVLQWQNLLPLVENSLSEGNTVMLVGDGKQAIYRWRNGDLEQFLQLPQLDRDQLDPASIREKEQLLQAHYQERELVENHRSAPRIVACNNELFPVLDRILMQGAEEVGAGHLKELFQSGEQDPGRKDDAGYVRFELLPAQTASEKEEEGDRVIERIIATIQGPLSDVPPSDIAILTRTNARGAAIAAALMEADIEVLSGESLHLDQSQEVNFLVELLRVVEDPTNEIAKLDSIRSLLAHQGRQEEIHALLAPHWYQDEDEKKARIDISAFWRSIGTPFDIEEARRAPLYRSIEDAIRVFGLDRPASPYVQFFLDHLFAFSERYGDDLQGFLEDWDKMKNKPSIKVPSELDAVKVMTVHGAKGLEFPYVILPEPETSIRYSKSRIWVDPNGYIPELPAVLLPMNKRLQKTPERYAQEEAKERYRSRLDALNLLYVAMTRAEEASFVLIPEPPRNAEASERIDQALVRAVEELYGELSEEGISIGSLPETHREKVEDGSKAALTSIPHEAWDERVKIRFRAPSDWRTEDPEGERGVGHLMHEALARILRKKDKDRVLSELMSEGRMAEDLAEVFDRSISSILEHEGAAPYFDPAPHQKLFAERDILTSDGRFIRPDRVLIDGKEAWVLEIKTGSKDPSHHHQLSRYKKALEQMGYEAYGKLLYTQGPEMVELEEDPTTPKS